MNSLCDGNPKTIAQILEDESHQRDIENLIANYCQKDGQYYVERKDISKPNEDAIDISTLSGTDFEILVQSLLKEEGYENVIKMGVWKSKDNTTLVGGLSDEHYYLYYPY